MHLTLALTLYTMLYIECYKLCHCAGLSTQTSTYSSWALEWNFQ